VAFLNSVIGISKAELLHLRDIVLTLMESELAHADELKAQASRERCQNGGSDSGISEGSDLIESFEELNSLGDDYNNHKETNSIEYHNSQDSSLDVNIMDICITE